MLGSKSGAVNKDVRASRPRKSQRVNATAAGYRPPSGETIRAFRETVRRAGVSNSVRAERGDDIAAACGQLRTHEKTIRT